ncbi:MAG: hypothetical protein ACOYLD_04350 [Anaerohalosphaeraceae bacterium]|jgi:hypothetical protein
MRRRRGAKDYRYRRVFKKITVDMAAMEEITYGYDDDQVIAEYDDSGVPLRKYVYGPALMSRYV